MPRVPKPSTALVPMTSAELEAALPEDLHAECWLLSVTGHTQKQLSERFGVSRATIQNWLKKSNLEYRHRHQSIDEERERIAGTMEAVLADAYQAHRAAPKNSLAGSNYLRLVLDAAREVAHIRGVTAKTTADNGSKGTTEVIVKIGGGGPAQPEIAVGVRAS